MLGFEGEDKSRKAPEQMSSLEYSCYFVSNPDFQIIPNPLGSC
jgi:hypothetical protein